MPARTAAPTQRCTRDARSGAPCKNKTTNENGDCGKHTQSAIATIDVDSHISIDDCSFENDAVSLSGDWAEDVADIVGDFGELYT